MFAADVQIPMIAVAGASVDRPAGSQGVDRRLPQFLHVIIVAGLSFIGEFRSSSEADAQFGRQCPGPQAPLPSAAVDEWRRLLAFLHPQSSNSLGPVNLVRGHGNE